MRKRASSREKLSGREIDNLLGSTEPETIPSTRAPPVHPTLGPAPELPILPKLGPRPPTLPPDPPRYGSARVNGIAGISTQNAPDPASRSSSVHSLPGGCVSLPRQSLPLLIPESLELHRTAHSPPLTRLSLDRIVTIAWEDTSMSTLHLTVRPPRQTSSLP